MSAAIAELFDKASDLPPDQREQLALMLLDTLPESDAPLTIDPEYEARLERRLDDIRTGRAIGHDLETVMSSLRATLKRRSAS